MVHPSPPPQRLLQQKSSSEEAERLFISKLKTEYGYRWGPRGQTVGPKHNASNLNTPT